MDEADQSSVLFQNVAESMETACNHLRNGPGQANMSSHFNHEHFWTCIRASSNKLSNEVTKLSLIFSKDPLPSTEDIRELTQSLESAYVDTLTTFYMLPKEKGSSLHTIVKRAMLALMEAVCTVVQSLKDTGAQAQKNRLSQTGLVWEACEAIISLPETNLHVLCQIFDDEEGLVVDALQEIEDEVNADSLIPLQEDLEINLSESWNNVDRPLLPPCIGLVKTARAVLKKVSKVMRSQAKCDTVEQITELDELAVAVKAFSPAVDDLIGTMYPPLNRDSVKSAASVLVAKIDQMLKTVQESHYITEDDQTWIDFLLKAIEHNDNKLQQQLLLVSY